jgi:hypothetical protein
MSWREAALNVGVCMLIFLAGFAVAIHTMVFGSEADKRLVLKIAVAAAAVILALEALRFAFEGELCMAGMLGAFAVVVAVGAVFVL